jgi:DNA-binding response OmpR family regulator
MRVLICDDEPSIRQLYRYAFEHEGADVDEAGDGNECIAVADVAQPDLIVLDLYMPVRDGLSALPELRHKSPGSRVLVVSAHAGVEIFGRSRALGATACYEKLGFLRKIPEIVARYAA